MDSTDAMARKLRVMGLLKQHIHSMQCAVAALARCPARDAVVRRLAMFDQIMARYRTGSGHNDNDLSYLEA